jgi:hypothetical protein
MSQVQETVVTTEQEVVKVKKVRKQRADKGQKRGPYKLKSKDV